jgi:hypothetical protein
MQIEIKNFKRNPGTVLRQAGYHFQGNDGKAMSFVRPLASAGFPRFHIYATYFKNDLILNLHLDQKRRTYGKATRHHGEYEEDGPLKEEAQRLKNILG